MGLNETFVVSIPMSKNKKKTFFSRLRIRMQDLVG